MARPGTAWYIGGGAAIVMVITAFLVFAGNSEPAAAEEVTIYKSPGCGCCEGYASYLRTKGYEVKVVAVDDMASVKARYGIPPAMESCHTAVFGDYAVEGHVPMEAVEKLLAERPAVDGIALPRMPAGSPGMPGTKQGPFAVSTFSGGTSSAFVRV